MSEKIIRALLSVSDKTNIVTLAQELTKHKVHILSTGGTAKVLKEAGIAITDVSSHTNFPEIMGGRVKTLHPIIHGGILADRTNEKHLSAMEVHDIPPIDMVVVNLYPFSDTLASGADIDTCIENIDIGGPTMIRAGAKNHNYITVLTDPSQYDEIIEELNTLHGQTTLETRRKLAKQAFGHCGVYDAKITNWLSSISDDETPENFFEIGTRKETLRYGENPHQKASLYITDSSQISIANATQYQGKPLSYNNLNDGDASFAMVCDFDVPTCAIIKHANPCGIASGENGVDAFEKALACDPVSAFGGIVAFNCTVNKDIIHAMKDLFIEVIIAPYFTEDAKEALLIRTNVRVLETGGLMDTTKNTYNIKKLNGALLLQDKDNVKITREDCTVVTKNRPTEEQWKDLLFAFKTVKHVTSNALVLARSQQTVGIGAGQMSRIDSANIMCNKAKEFLGSENTVIASDAFFPFADALEICTNAGAMAVIQPGGSKNDDQVIELCNTLGIPMVFTNTRHFKH